MRIAYDVDDLSPYNHRFDLIEKLRTRYPEFKVTMFMIPWDIRYSPETKGTPITEAKYRPWVDYVIKGIEDGWLQISLHGLTHAPREFENLTYHEAKQRVTVGQKMLINVGIEHNGLFKAPQWLLNDDAKKAVEDLGFRVMEDGYYNWNTKDDIPKRKRKIIAHGHVQDVCGNGIDESYVRLTKIPSSAEWVWLKDLIS